MHLEEEERRIYINLTAQEKQAMKEEAVAARVRASILLRLQPQFQNFQINLYTSEIYTDCMSLQFKSLLAHNCPFYGLAKCRSAADGQEVETVNVMSASQYSVPVSDG